LIQPALLGGLFIGILSALPVVGWGNCCCCLWVVGGGMLATYLDADISRPRTLARGAADGFLAGVIGAFVWLPLALVVAALLGPLQERFLELARNANDMSPQVRDILDNVGNGSVVGTVIGFMFQLFIGTIFAAIGGVLSAAYFKKEVPPALGGDWIPPLPPQ